MNKADKRILLTPSHIARRRLPKNISGDDLIYFQNVLETEIGDVFVNELEHVAILKSSIFLISKWKFDFPISHILPVNKMNEWKRLYLFLLPHRSVTSAFWITDEWSAEYFHWLTDALPRLITTEKYFGKQVVLLPVSYQSKTYIAESLELLEIVPEYYDQKKAVFIKKLMYANHTAPTGNYNNDIINDLRERLNASMGVCGYGNMGVKGRKVYVSRGRALRRKILNEESVTAVMTELGFEIHYFEDYTLPEQIQLMSETKYLAGLHGAGLTNMLFMRPGSKILEIRKTGDSHNNAYFSLASDLEHQYFYLLADGTSGNTQETDFMVDTEKLRQVLVEMGE